LLRHHCLHLFSCFRSSDHGLCRMGANQDSRQYRKYSRTVYQQRHHLNRCNHQKMCEIGQTDGLRSRKVSRQQGNRYEGIHAEEWRINKIISALTQTHEQAQWTVYATNEYAIYSSRSSERRGILSCHCNMPQRDTPIEPHCAWRRWRQTH
jgi:hypothetical protein